MSAWMEHAATMGDVVGAVALAVILALIIGGSCFVDKNDERANKRIAALERQIRELNPVLPPVEGA